MKDKDSVFVLVIDSRCHFLAFRQLVRALKNLHTILINQRNKEMTAANYNPPIPFICTMALLKVNASQNSTNMNAEY